MEEIFVSGKGILVLFNLWENLIYINSTRAIRRWLKNGSAIIVQTKNKWKQHNAWAKVLILVCMNDGIITLHENYEIAKETVDVVDVKYGLRSFF